MNACYQKPCRASRDEGNYSDGGDEAEVSDDENPAVTMTLVETPAPAPMVTVPETTVAHSEVEHNVAGTLVALREAPVVHAPASAPGPSSDIPTIALPTAAHGAEEAQGAISAQVPSEMPEGGVTPVPASLQIITATDTTATETITAAADDTVAQITVPPTEQLEDHQENLDDPDEFDWEGRADIDFGDEPNDETW